MSRLTDKEMEIEIGLMLRIGVTVSALIVFLGGIHYLSSVRELPNYAQFHGTAPGLSTIAGVFQGLVRWDAASLIQLGILVLIATPVVRVAFCVVGFARQRDRLYVAVSLLVLAILIYSLMAGARYGGR